MPETKNDPNAGKDTSGAGDSSGRNPELMAKLEALGVAGPGTSPGTSNLRERSWWRSRFILVPALIFVILGTLLLYTDLPEPSASRGQVIALDSGGRSAYPYGVPQGARLPRTGTPAPPARNWRPVSPHVRPPAMSSPGIVPPNSATADGQQQNRSLPPPAPVPYYYRYPRNVVPYNRYAPYPPPYMAQPAPGFGPYPHGYYFPPPPPPQPYPVPRTRTYRGSTVPYGVPPQ